MKQISFTLAFYILFMAFLPSMTIIIKKATEPACHQSCCRKTCCHSAMMIKKTKKDEQKDDCSKGGCTPFIGCCSIQFFTSPINISEYIPITEKIKFHLMSENPNNRYISEYWRPPEMV